MALTSACTVRPATVDDHAAFARLALELGTGDPIPTADVWAATIMAGTRVATIDGRVVGYCYFQAYHDAGYVRALAVDPAARRRGVARALMRVAADELRAQGLTSWRLNVKPDNVAALALYRSLGLQPAYLAKALQLPWRCLPQLPRYGAAVRVAGADRDAALGNAFALPRGQLTQSRAIGRTIFEAVPADQSAAPILGLANFNPHFPGAFPFRTADPRVAGDLLDAMRALVPDDQRVYLTVEDDQPLAALLLSVGAISRMDIVHLLGPL